MNQTSTPILAAPDAAARYRQTLSAPVNELHLRFSDEPDQLVAARAAQRSQHESFGRHPDAVVRASLNTVPRQVSVETFWGFRDLHRLETTCAGADNHTIIVLRRDGDELGTLNYHQETQLIWTASATISSRTPEQLERRREGVKLLDGVRLTDLEPGLRSTLLKLGIHYVGVSYRWESDESELEHIGFYDENNMGLGDDELQDRLEAITPTPCKLEYLTDDGDDIWWGICQNDGNIHYRVATDTHQISDSSE